jgi:hypothetical protein
VFCLCCPLYYHNSAWKSMGLGQNKPVCRRPLGARQMAQTFSSLLLELVFVCGRQAIKDAGVAVCGALMGAPGYKAQRSQAGSAGRRSLLWRPGIQRFSVISHPMALVVCHVVSWQLSRLDLQRLADDSLSGHTMPWLACPPHYARTTGKPQRVAA